MANNTQIASDTFASGSLAAGWTAFPGLSACQVAAGPPKVTEPNATATRAGQYWTGNAFPNDQICEVTVQAHSSEVGTDLQMWVRFDGVNNGYIADFTNSTLLIFKVVAGSATQIGVTTNTVILSVGDVLTFAATGSCLFVYKNWKPVYFIPDATFHTGGPAYTQIAAVAVTHSQISSWRGYSRVQQDGIWTKQSIVLPPIAADITSNGSGVVGAQILQGTGVVLSGTVYQMWSSGGNIQGASAYVIYAESTDGINWTRGSNQLSGYQEPGVTKFGGSTYFLYAQTGVGLSTANVQAFTSSDGVNWSAAHDTGIGLGAGAAWDSKFIYNIIPVDKIGATYYGLYGAGDNLTTVLFSLGMITSSDGLNWTKYGGNPVQVGIQPAFTKKVNGIYYMWAAIAQPGQSLAASSVNPAESVMWSSPDLITWTKVCFAYHHSNIDENVNGVIGQGNVSYMLDVGGQTYNYTVASPDDLNAATLFFQLGLATAPYTLEQLTTLARQDGTVQVASDAFTSGAGDLSANWTTPTGLTKLKIVSGPFCEPSAFDVHNVMCYTGGTFGANHYSEITIHALHENGDYAFPIVRQSTTAFTCYRALIDGPMGTFQANTICNIYKTVAGANTIIGPTAAITPQVGDVWRLAVIDDPTTGVPVISLYQNGGLIMQVQDYGTKITGGFPGVNLFASSAGSVGLQDTQISLWAGGNAGTLPTIPASGNAGALRLRRRRRIYGS